MSTWFTPQPPVGTGQSRGGARSRDRVAAGGGAAQSGTTTPNPNEGRSTSSSPSPGLARGPRSAVFVPHVVAVQNQQMVMLQQRLRLYKAMAPGLSSGISPAIGSEAVFRMLSSPTMVPGAPSRRGVASPVESAANRQSPTGGLQNADESDIRIVPDPIFEDGVFRVWLREHPFASKEEVQAEIKRRNAEKVEHERSARLKQIRSWQMELAELERQEELSKLLAIQEEKQRIQEQENAQRREGRLSAEGSDLRPKTAPVQRDAADFKLQKAAWDLFQKTSQELLQPATPRTYRAGSSAGVAVLGSASNGEVGSGWVEKEWKTHTHRHEIAALKIQCAFRVMVAKRRLRLARVRRQRIIQATLKSEESAKLAWEMAVASSEVNALSQSAVDSRFKAIEFWRTQMSAKITRRRKAMKKAEDAKMETENYAATRIQARWRGVRERQMVKEMLDPGIAAERLNATTTKAATQIQRMMRGFLARKRLAARTHKALIIQRAFRSFAAYKRLAALRREYRIKETQAGRDFAARIVQRCFRRALRSQRRKLKAFESQFLVLQRVGRGWLARRTELQSVVLRKRSFAATRIQCVVRQRQSRNTVKRRRAEIEQSVQLGTRQEAARIITAAIRRGVAVLALKYRRRRKWAAMEIQRVYRGFKGRIIARSRRASLVETTRTAKQDDAAITIQALYRQWKVRSSTKPTLTAYHQNRQQRVEDDIRSYAEVGAEAANTIRRFYKRFVRRHCLKRFLRIHAMRIVKAIRRFYATSSVEEQHELAEARRRRALETDSAAIIQRNYRVHRSRVAVEAARARREKEQQEIRKREAVDVIHRFFRRVRPKRLP